MENQYSTLRLTIVVRLSSVYALRIHPSGRHVYLIHWWKCTMAVWSWANARTATRPRLRCVQYQRRSDIRRLSLAVAQPIPVSFQRVDSDKKASASGTNLKSVECSSKHLPAALWRTRSITAWDVPHRTIRACRSAHRKMSEQTPRGLGGWMYKRHVSSRRPIKTS